MSLLQLAAYIKDVPSAVSFLRDRRIIRSIHPNCTICDRLMTEIKCGTVSDGVIYRCPSHKGQKVSVRRGSFLENANISAQQFIIICYLWSHSISIHHASEMSGISEHTLIDWYNFIRNACEQYLKTHPFSLGGLGKVVEIDESLVSKRKYHVGHAVPQRWVFGGYDNSLKLGFIKLVPDRSANTLLPLIQEYIAPGTEIHSDSWAAYNGIKDLRVKPPYTHKTVNHSQNFVDPVSGACTNHVECMWKNAKQQFKRMSGTSENLLPSYMEEFMWRQQRGKTAAEGFDNILTDIAEWYKVPY